ncbi:hypothetical protein PTNB29_09870 [Pyrenophora teres f. teres]|nr:hypothetical protein PTNB29_09870 [Pyrenophora teres f. teres]
MGLFSLPPEIISNIYRYVGAVFKEELKFDGEIFYILTECFHKLKHSPFLKVGSCNKGLEKLMLGFLSSTKLPRRVLSHGIILSVLVESETSEHDVTEQLTPEYKDYMKSIEVNIPQLRKVRDMTERMRLLEREQLKDIGYHFRDYSWFSPGISIFICDCNELLALKVVACEAHLRSIN